MGKSKKRILHLGIHNTFENITREQALKQVLRAFSRKSFDDSTKDLITLFGISSEELLELGAKYEDVMSMQALLN
ncbi:hypothetical protein IJ732_07745 [bacterium]|nr:hypothetical protein [bacterium]